MKKYKTEQEEFWAGNFGDDYTARNNGENIISANMALFSRVLQNKAMPESIIEFGANRGLNLLALQKIAPSASLTALEINQTAVSALARQPGIEVVPTSILDYEPQKTYDLVLIKGVMIHINPESLPELYERLYRSSGRYILIAEYYNPTPVTVSYRGHEQRLFKRDFAGEMLDRFSDLALLDYGFCYHRDRMFPLDDISWFLLEKAKGL